MLTLWKNIVKQKDPLFAFIRQRKIDLYEYLGKQIFLSFKGYTLINKDKAPFNIL